jgi:hypothetical protein
MAAVGLWCIALGLCVSVVAASSSPSLLMGQHI